MGSEGKKVNGESLQRYFFEEYRVKKGDTLTSIAKAHGFSNPGPIAYFPLNGKKYNVLKNYDNILVNQAIAIPYSQERLDEAIKKLEIIVKSSRLKGFKHDMEKVRKKIKNNEIKNFINLLTLLTSYKKIFELPKVSKKLLKNKSREAIIGLKVSQFQYFFSYIDDQLFNNDKEIAVYLKIIFFNIPTGISPFNLAISLANIGIDSYTHVTLKIFDKLVKGTSERANHINSLSIRRLEGAQKQKQEGFYKKRI